MKGGGAFLIILVGVLLLAAVLYGKTGCFGGFWNCAFGSLSKTGSATGSNTTGGGLLSGSALG